MKTLVIGATGNIGKELVQQLHLQNLHPRIASRNPHKAKQLFPFIKEAVYFDFNQQDTFAKAVNGMEQIFMIAPHDNPTNSVRAFLKIAQEAGIQYIVLSTGRTTANIVGKPLYYVEQVVKESGLDYTIVRPGWFMQNFKNWIGGDAMLSESKFYLPAGESKTAFIDVRDIAAVAVRLLTNSAEHLGKIYELTSDEALTHDEVAHKIACALKQPVTYVALSDEAYIDKKMQEGWSNEKAKYTVMLYKIVRQTGKEAKVSKDVERILHRLPISFDEFVETYYGVHMV